MKFPLFVRACLMTPLAITGLAISAALVLGGSSFQYAGGFILIIGLTIFVVGSLALRDGIICLKDVATLPKTVTGRITAWRTDGGPNNPTHYITVGGEELDA